MASAVKGSSREVPCAAILNIADFCLALNSSNWKVRIFHLAPFKVFIVNYLGISVYIPSTFPISKLRYIPRFDISGGIIGFSIDELV